MALRRPRPVLLSLLIVLPILMSILEHEGPPPAPVSPGAPPPATGVPPGPASSPAATASPSGPAHPAASPAPTGRPRTGAGRREDPHATFTGVVLDAQSGQPLNRASVAIPELSIETFTDERGAFKIHSVPGRTQPYEVMVQHPGHENHYDSQALRAGQTATATYRLRRRGY